MSQNKWDKTKSNIALISKEDAGWIGKAGNLILLLGLPQGISSAFRYIYEYSVYVFLWFVFVSHGLFFVASWI